MSNIKDKAASRGVKKDGFAAAPTHDPRQRDRERLSEALRENLKRRKASEKKSQ